MTDHKDPKPSGINPVESVIFIILIIVLALCLALSEKKDKPLLRSDGFDNSEQTVGH